MSVDSVLSVPSAPNFRHVVLVTLVFSFLSCLFLPMISDVDTCVIDRIREPQKLAAQNQVLSSTTRMAIAIVLLLLCLFWKAVKHSDQFVTDRVKHYGPKHDADIHKNLFFIPKKIKCLEAFKIILCYMFYLGLYFLGNALKVLFADTACHYRPNSISGHYLFFSLTIFMVYYFHINQSHILHTSLFHPSFYTNLVKDKIFVIMFSSYIVFVFSILIDTYMYGYHSLRQILYGFFIAMAGVAFLLDLFDYFDHVAIFHIVSSSSPSSLTSQSTSIHLDHIKQRLSFPLIHRLSQRLPILLFPMLFTFVFQVLCFIILAVFCPSDTPLYTAPDVITCILGWISLCYIFKSHLHLNFSQRKQSIN